eukprot:TRINITY_DN275_c0_g1_i2.p1 TRINITY_DN275_c0_g1~~TRINITY_DN275_c0_g1_i2.p1  ORF type:complete len:712 (+),score=156.50 TRINITY_DN275_c0_g1_i2:157-2136(+)
MADVLLELWKKSKRLCVGGIDNLKYVLELDPGFMTRHGSPPLLRRAEFRAFLEERGVEKSHALWSLLECEKVKNALDPERRTKIDLYRCHPSDFSISRSSMLKLRHWQLPSKRSTSAVEGDFIGWVSSDGIKLLYPSPLWEDGKSKAFCRPGLSLSCETIAPDFVRRCREYFLKDKGLGRIPWEDAEKQRSDVTNDFVEKEYNPKDHEGMSLDTYLLSEGLRLFHVLKLPKGTFIPENLALENDHDDHYSLSVNDDSGVPIRSDGVDCFVESIESLGWIEEPMIVMSGRGSLPDWFAPPGGAMEAVVSIALASSDVDILLTAMKFCCEVPDEMVSDPNEREELFDRTVVFIRSVMSDEDVEVAEAAEDETKMTLGIVGLVVVFGDNVLSDDEITSSDSNDDEEPSEEDMPESDKYEKKKLKLKYNDVREFLLSKTPRTSISDEIITLLEGFQWEDISIVSGSVTVVFEQLPPGEAKKLENILTLDRSTCNDILQFCAKKLGSSPSNLVPFFVKSSRLPCVIPKSHCFIAAIRLDEKPSLFYCHRASRSIARALSVLRDVWKENWGIRVWTVERDHGFTIPKSLHKSRDDFERFISCDKLELLFPRIQSTSGRFLLVLLYGNQEFDGECIAFEAKSILQESFGFTSPAIVWKKDFELHSY